MAHLELIQPDWPAPASVRACATTRIGGISSKPYDGLNLGQQVADDPQSVFANRSVLRVAAALPAEPCWLEQVHGIAVIPAVAGSRPAIADGSVTADEGVVCAVLTADCLPVLMTDDAGTRVAAVHAGWRGLAAGILEAAVADFDRAGITAKRLMAWLGPAIGPAAYEVGEEVRAAFSMSGDGEGFARNSGGRWQCDLYSLAQNRLLALGLPTVYGGGYCTHHDTGRFFSYRRDGLCGRQASLIWLDQA